MKCTFLYICISCNTTANHYKEYSDLKKQLRSEVGETPRSLSSGSRILFPETRNSQPAPCLERQYTEEEAFWLNVSPSDIVQSQNSDNPSPDPCSTIKKRKLVLAEANIEERKRKKLAGEPKKTKKKLSKDYMYYSLQFKSEEKNTKSKTQSQEVVNVTDEDKEDDKTPYEIVSYEELQHVRHTKYKFEWQDDSFCTVSEEYSPDEIFLSQREIIKTRLMNKTLGMVTEENEELEKNALEKLFQIAKNNKIIIPEVKRKRIVRIYTVPC